VGLACGEVEVGMGEFGGGTWWGVGGDRGRGMGSHSTGDEGVWVCGRRLSHTSGWAEHWLEEWGQPCSRK
jgi:hypothetical protein